MAKEKRVSIGAVNITMHPHSPEKYAQLFNDAKKYKCISIMAKHKAGLIASVNPLKSTLYEISELEEKKVQPLTGDLYRFSNIDLEGSWFNTQTSKHADESELENINVPEYLKPNSSRFSYIFFPESHVLFYESYYDGHSLGSRSALKLIEGVLNHSLLAKDYGVIDVTVIPCKDALSQALSISRMDKLTMLITRPNPDDHSDTERKVLERLNAQNIEKYEHELTSLPKTGITPDKDTKTLAHVAARNGLVEVKGRDTTNHPVQYSTKNHPWTKSEYYDPNIQTAFNTFLNSVLRVRKKVEKWSDNE